jgi:choline dehydrogenase-like flavoprotein
METNLNRRSFLTRLGSLLATLSVPALNSTTEADQHPNSRTGRFGDIDRNTLFDVCIIGSGFAGAILGESLVRRGIKTVILESGPDPREKSIDPRFRELEVFRSSGPIDYPIVSTRFRGVGGTSWLWGGNCTRLHPLDFENSSYTPAGASWPITYADLEPYYEQAERALRVRGGKPSKFHPPIRTAYPLPEDRNFSPLQSLLGKVGIVASGAPFSTPLNRDPSIASGRFGRFVRMTDSHLASFQASSAGALIPGITVSRLLVDAQGSVSGAEVRNLDRDTKIVRAHVYVIACGGLESPRLLLLSRSTGFPNGIGNNHDCVGRYFTEHRPVSFSGQVKVDWSSFNLYQLKGFSYQFYKKFKEEGLGGLRFAFHLHGMTSWKEIYAGQFTRILDETLTRQLDVTIEAEMKPAPENRVTLDKKVKDYFGNPVTNVFLSDSADEAETINRAQGIVQKIYTNLGVVGVKELPRNVWAHHHMGTCRMGNNPRTSVVNRNLQVHGTRNLFLAGSSVFVTSGTAHPTLSLTALSLRLSDYLPLQLRNGAFSVSYGNSK